MKYLILLCCVLGYVLLNNWGVFGEESKQNDPVLGLPYENTETKRPETIIQFEDGEIKIIEPEFHHPRRDDCITCHSCEH